MLDSLRMRRTGSEVVNLDLTCNATFPSPVHARQVIPKTISARMKASELKESVQSYSNFVTHKKSLSHSDVYTSPLDSSDSSFFAGLVLVTLISCVTRLYGISEPPHVA